MYCEDCGSKLENGVCPKCKPEVVVNTNTQVEDTGSFGWGVLGFFFPLVGLILFIVWMNTKPLSSKKAGIGALIGVIASIVLSIIITVIFIVIASNTVSSGYYYNYYI